MRFRIALLLMILPFFCEAKSVAKPSAAKSPPVFEPSLRMKVQILLDKKGYSPGEIDGTLGNNTKKALAAFQRFHELKPTGVPDSVTMNALQDGDSDLLLHYKIDDDDVVGPFTPKIPRDMVAKTKLQSLEYTSPMELLSEKFHVNPVVLQKMNPGAKFKKGETILVPDVVPLGEVIYTRADVRPVTVTVSEKDLSVTVTDEKGNVLMYAPVTLGMKGAPLPIGKWQVDDIEDFPTFHYDPRLMVKKNPKHKKDVFINPGPNNPVGIAWIDLSVSHLGMHGTSEPSKIGHRASNGCIRLTNWDVYRLASMVEPGTEVHFVDPVKPPAPVKAAAKSNSTAKPN